MSDIDRYPEDRLYEEVAFIAYHFHWSREEVMALPHHERRRWCEEISKINDRINRSAEEPDRTPGVTLEQPIDFEGRSP